MRAIIIEDEQVAAEELSLLIKSLAPEIRIEAVLQSIEESVEWFGQNTMPDLAFMDIHLADGSSFAIFDEVNVTCPVIFTTAYDEYAIRAFEVNSVDYLLKPIRSESLCKAIEKFRKYSFRQEGKTSTDISSDHIAKLINDLRVQPPSYKSSLLVNQRDRLIPLPVREIAYVHIDLKIVRAETFGGQGYNLDMTMDELEAQLDPAEFFRANRQYIISRSAVKDLSMWFSNKLAVNLNVPAPERIQVSKARVKEFKKWLTEN